MGLTKIPCVQLKTYQQVATPWHYRNYINIDNYAVLIIYEINGRLE